MVIFKLEGLIVSSVGNLQYFILSCIQVQKSSFCLMVLLVSRLASFESCMVSTPRVYLYVACSIFFIY